MINMDTHRLHDYWLERETWKEEETMDIMERFHPFIGNYAHLQEYGEVIQEETETCRSCGKKDLLPGTYHDTEFGDVVCDCGEYGPDWEDDEEHKEHSCLYNLHCCDECTDLVQDLNMIADSPGNGTWICPECAESMRLVICDECDEYYLAHDMRDVTPRFCCPTCFESKYFVCTECDQAVEQDETYHNSNGGPICQRCYEDGYFCCDDCNDIFDIEVCHSDENGNRILCPSCNSSREAAEYDDDTSDIYDYGYHPTCEFFGPSTEGRMANEFAGLYVGVETEIGTTDEKARIGEDATHITNMSKGLFYCKEDCSIISGSIEKGFEVVSHPFTLEWFRKEGKRYVNPLWKMTDNGYEEKARSCGMHVHMSKEAFNGWEHAYRFARFMYEKHNQDFMVKISGRESIFRLDKWASIRKGDKATGNYKDGLNMCEFLEQDDRYEGFNTLTDDTYEIRIFASTLIQEEWEKNLEWCYAMFLFTYNDDEDTFWNMYTCESFLVWLGMYRNMFPNLTRFLEDEGYTVGEENDMAVTNGNVIVGGNV